MQLKGTELLLTIPPVFKKSFENSQVCLFVEKHTHLLLPLYWFYKCCSVQKAFCK